MPRSARATAGAGRFLDSRGGSDYRLFVGNDLAEAEGGEDAAAAFGARAGNLF